MNSALNELFNNPDYQILKRLPENFEKKQDSENRQFTAMIIDIETTGLDAKSNAIIELGALTFSFTTEEGIIEVLETYNGLQDPLEPIPEKITQITGITNEDVAGKSIDWDRVITLLRSCNLVICHNSGFDRNFLEIQTPENVEKLFKEIPFACTMKDINWEERGLESAKLDYLNWKLGYFYEGHRALTDCWAVFNLLIEADGAFEELKNNTKKIEMLLCAVDAPYDKKDLLKERKYRWADGAGNLPKCWWTVIPHNTLEEETSYLETYIYGRKGSAKNLPQAKITARTRYSYRAEVLG